MALCRCKLQVVRVHFVLCLLYIARVSNGAPTPEITKDVAIGFLARYGYIDAAAGEAQALHSGERLSEEELKDAISEVQRFGGIPQTGQLDQETLKLMSSKRCGMPDVVVGAKEEHGDESVTESRFPSDGDGPVHHHHGEDDSWRNHPHHYHHHHHHHHNDDEENWPHQFHFHNDTGLRQRKKRYILASGGWDKRDLYYYLENTDGRLSREDIIYTLQSALDAWATWGRLRFRETSNPKEADITFAFYRQQHGDPYPFDGRGNVLAHAFFPGSSLYAGDVHFDEDELWKINMPPWEDGTDLFTVALHELGHSLGLSHSPVTGSIMNPYYRGTSKELGYDDILAMHHLYASRRLKDGGSHDSRPRTTHFPPLTPRGTTAPPTRPTTTASTTTRPEVTTTRKEVTNGRKPQGEGSWGGPSKSLGCFGGYDTVTLIRNELFIIKDQMMWRLKGPGQIQPKYPVEFRRFFHLLPSYVKRIDSIYQREHDSKIIIFTGKMFWVFDGTNFIENSPRPLKEYGIPDDIERIDAVISFKGKTYLFVGEEYWEFDDQKKKPISRRPKPISDWGLSGPIDTALTYKNGELYFFKDDYFWEYDETHKRLKPHSSRQLASEYWLSC